MVNRRIWIRQVAAAGGGLMLVPSCLQNSKQAPVRFKNITLSNDDETLLADVVDAIIPATGTAGARELNVHLFVLKMIDDCYVKEDQQAFIAGLKKLGSYTKEKTGKSFAKVSAEAKVILFKSIADDASPEKELRYFLLATKQLSITGYTQSKYVMTNLNKYELVPGRFRGCVKLQKAV